MKRAFVLILLVIASPASAQFAVVGGTGESVPHTDKTIGWAFQVLQPMSLTGLGWGPFPIPGPRTQEHLVGLWRHGDNGYELIVEATLPPDDDQLPLEGVRFHPPMVLSPGLYTIGGLDHPDEENDVTLLTGEFPLPMSDVSPFNAFPEFLQVGQAVISDQPGFHVPTVPYADPKSVLLGPSIYKLPEPSSGCLLLVGCLFFGFVQRCRKISSVVSSTQPWSVGLLPKN